MRIVMLTDDAPSIDRRILLEAEALIDEGHEVIVLTRTVDGVDRGRRLGRVKVEHIPMFAGADRKPPVAGILLIVAQGLRQSKHPLIKILIHLGSRARPILRLVSQDGLFEYLNTQKRRLSDPWIPLRRKTTIATKTSAIALAAAGLGIARSIFRAVAPKELKLAGPDFLSKPFDLTAWDAALVQRARFYDPDVIHVHDLPQLYAGYLAAKSLKVPLIYDAHEVYSEIKTLSEEQKHWLRARERFAIKKCNRVITINPLAAEWFHKTYGVARPTVIMNATRRPADLVLPARRRYFHEFAQIPENHRVIVYQGWFSTEEGRALGDLVKAFSMVRRDIHLCMIGYGDHDHFRRLAQAAGVADRVHTLQAVPWTELLYWTASADAGIIPYRGTDVNHQICSPNKLYEFIAAQLPMIVNDLPYLRMLVGGEGFGLVRNMTCPSDIAAAINDFFDPATQLDVTARRNLATHGWRFEWEEEQKKLLDCYKGLPDARRPKYAGPTTRLAMSGSINPPERIVSSDLKMAAE